MQNLNELLSELEVVLKKIKSPILKRLNEGLSKTAADNLFQEVNVFNDKLMTFYRWKNGVSAEYADNAIEYLELFPGSIMLSLEEAIILYRQSVKEQLWSAKLFPILTNGGGEHLLFAWTKGTNSTGKILLYAPSLLLDEAPQTIYDSFENLISTSILCFRKEAYKISSDGTFEVDYDLKYDISGKLNKDSVYWDEYR